MTREKRIKGYKKAIKLLSKEMNKNPNYCRFGLCYALSKVFAPLDAYENMDIDFPDIAKYNTHLGYWFPLNADGHKKRIEILETEIKFLESELV